jgi:hypothetical protein
LTSLQGRDIVFDGEGRGGNSGHEVAEGAEEAHDEGGVRVEERA